MTIEQITDIAWAVVSELEPARSVDVFEVSELGITFQDDGGLFKIAVPEQTPQQTRQRIKRQLLARFDALL